MNLRLLGVLLLVLFVAGCAATGPEPVPEKGKTVEQPAPKVEPNALAAYASAVAAMRAGNTAVAEAKFQKLAMDYPQYSGPHNNLGIIYYHAGKLDKAKASFSKALELNPKSVVSLNHLGIISRGEGDFKKAHEYYQKALEINPDYPYVHLNMGILLELYMGKLPEALEHYKRYQELSKEEDKKVTGWIVDLERRIK
ncbi:tetratricopeptide repeat protein [Kaarinaea lacus]